MALPDNYWQNMPQQAPQPQAQQPAAPSVAPTPQDKLQVAQQQAASATEEAQRSTLSRFGYEFYASTYNMPSQQNWDKMGHIDQQVHLNKEAWRTVGGMIKRAPREILKSGIQAGYTPYSFATKGIDWAIEKTTGKKVKPGAPDRFNVPWLGEIKNSKATYEDGIEMGLNPFMATVYAGSEYILDSAISYSLFEAAKIPFQPKVVTVEAEGLSKFGHGETIQKQIQGSMTPAQKLKQFATGGPASDTQYFRVSNNVARNYKGNANNTFLKARPLGNGKVEFSMVQSRKSLLNQGIDKLRNKFGRSKVTPGKFGPELILESGTITYDPQMAVMKSQSGLAKIDNAFTKGLTDPKLFTSQNSPLLTSQFAIVTAENPGAQALTPEANAVRNEKLLSELRRRGYEPIKQKGNYGREENSFIVPEMSDAEALEIGKMFDQESVLTPTGLIYQDGRVNPADIANTNFDSKQTDFFSTVNINGKDVKYSIPIDLENKVQMSEVKPIGVEHYSPEVGLTETDPAFAGTRGIGEEVAQKQYPELYTQETYFYEKGAKTEPLVTEGATKYTGEVKGKFLDVASEEYSEIAQQAAEFIKNDPKYGTADQSAIAAKTKQLAQEAGYKGMRDKDRGIVTSYDKVSVAEEAPFEGDEFVKKVGGEIPTAGQKPIKGIVQKPLKGSENAPATTQDIGKIKFLQDQMSIGDDMLQALSLTLNGKRNIYDLDKTEIYDLSESMRGFEGAAIETQDDLMLINRSFTHPARYWMESAEREFGYPIYTDIYLPMETAIRLGKVYSDRWGREAADVFGKYTDNKYLEERRLIDAYTEGDKQAILNNKKLSPETKQELIEIGDWLVENYKVLFKELGITSEKYFGTYKPNLRKGGGAHRLYKSGEAPAELKAFFEMEREGMLDPLEDDALANFQIYTRGAARNLFVAPAYEHALQLSESLPQNLSKATGDYIKEKMGYEDGLSEFVTKAGENLATKLNDRFGLSIPKDITKQVVDFLMTTSYAGALGIPRLMPLLRNLMQPILTTLPEVGAKYFASGRKDSLKPGAYEEVRDKGLFVNLGVPYGAELSEEANRSGLGKAVTKYENFNKATMKPYGQMDVDNRMVTYFSVKNRFLDNWDKLKNGKIDYATFEKEIDLNGFNPTLQNIVRQKLAEGTKKSTEEALDLMVVDVMDRTQFPYRKGTESRLHYGLKGKAGLQFSQWQWEYGYTLGQWVRTKSWDKIIRWMASAAAVKRTYEDIAEIDVDKWVGPLLSNLAKGDSFGPLSGLPEGPLAKIGLSVFNMIDSSLAGYEDDVNDNAKDIANAIKIYGGTVTGVGKQDVQKALESIKRWEAGVVQSPYPDRPFPVISSTGKVIDWVNGMDLLKQATSFDTIGEKDMSDRIKTMRHDSIEYANKINEAMDAFAGGDFKEFDKIVTKNDLLIPDLAAKLKSYQVPLDQRLFERLPTQLKMKYVNMIYPINN